MTRQLLWQMQIPTAMQTQGADLGFLVLLPARVRTQLIAQKSAFARQGLMEKARCIIQEAGNLG